MVLVKVNPLTYTFLALILFQFLLSLVIYEFIVPSDFRKKWIKLSVLLGTYFISTFLNNFESQSYT